jgi:putative DNA primase/helicase
VFPDPGSVPEELRLPRWVGWRWRENEKGEWKKPPCSAVTGAEREWPDSGVALEEALAGAKRLGLDGVGFVFVEGDGLFGVDFDDCVEGGKVHPEVEGVWLKWFSQTYKETSVSGTGIHIICRGRMPGALTKTPLAPGDRATVEAYARGRYFTFTGRRIGEANAIAECGRGIDLLLERFGKPAPEARKREWPPRTEAEIRAEYRRRVESLRALKVGEGGNDGLNKVALIAARTHATGVLGEATEAGTKAELLRVVTEEWESPMAPSEATSTIDSGWGAGAADGPLPTCEFALTDVGNAERFVSMHAAGARYQHQRKRWLVWDSRRWKPDEALAVEQLAKETVRSIEDAGFAKRAEADARITALVRRARSEPALVVTQGQLNADPWLLNCRNGTLDLRTGRLRAHRREDMITMVAGADFLGLDERSDALDSFAERVVPDPELRAYLFRALGYSLTGSTSEECYFILHGTGQNGKTTLLEMARSLLQDYARNANVSLFLERRFENPDGPTPGLARLVDARFVTAVEPKKNAVMAEGMIKGSTDGSTQTARFLHENEFEYATQYKLWLGVNYLPAIRDIDKGIWRRPRVIPFHVQIPDAERDLGLKARLRETALPALLAACVRGCLEWQRLGGLREPAAVTKAVDEYRDESDYVSAFVRECLAPCAPEKCVPLVQVFDVFTVYLRQQGHRHDPTTRWLARELRARDVKVANGTANKACVWGFEPRRERYDRQGEPLF